MSFTSPEVGTIQTIQVEHEGPTLETSHVEMSRWEFDGNTWKLKDYGGLRRGYLYARDLPRPMNFRGLLMTLRRAQRAQRPKPQWV